MVGGRSRLNEQVTAAVPAAVVSSVTVDVMVTERGVTTALKDEVVDDFCLLISYRLMSCWHEVAEV